MTGDQKRKRRTQRTLRVTKSGQNGLGFDALEPRQLLAAVTVGNLGDLVNGDTSSIASLKLDDGGDGISLREAVEAANEDLAQDSISFDPGLLGGTLILTQGELELDSDISIDGDVNDDGFSDITISGDNSDRVMRLDDSGEVTLYGLTIANGSSYRGGGILVNDMSTLNLLNSTVRDNVSFYYGGGIYNSGTLRMDNSTVSDNRAYGFGFVNPGYGGSPPYAEPAYAGGGGIYNTGYATINNSTIAGNLVEATGGGGYEYEGEFVEPAPGFAKGGGIYNSGDLTIVNTTIADNDAIGVGGGGGGGGYGEYGGGAYGGGLHNYGAANIVNVTFSQNSTYSSEFADGLNIYMGFSSTMNLANSLFVSDGSLDGSDIAGPGANTVLGGNVFAADVSDVFENGLNGPGSLEDNGGPVQTIALLDSPFNPALDVGEPLDETVLGIDLNGDGDTDDVIGTDARDLNRDVDQFGFGNGGTVDAGAYELNAEPPTGPPRISSRTILFGAGGRFDLWATLRVRFDSDVMISASSLSLFNDSTQMSVDISSATFDYDQSEFTATWTFDPGDPLDAAYYTHTLNALSITGVVTELMLDGDLDGDEGGDSASQHYVAIPGDANLDGQVNVLGDGFALVSSLGTSSGAMWSEGDFNGDRQVNVLGDGFVLVSNLGRSVIPPTATLSSKSVVAFSSSSIQTSSLIVTSRETSTNEQSVSTAGVPKLVLSQPSVLSGHIERDDAFAEDELYDWEFGVSEPDAEDLSQSLDGSLAG